MKVLFKKSDNQLLNTAIKFVITKDGQDLEEQAQHPFAYEQSLATEKPYQLNYMYYKDQ
jgi:hypothetical protein